MENIAKQQLPAAAAKCLILMKLHKVDTTDSQSIISSLLHNLGLIKSVTCNAFES